ncbi:MAG: hypothetical protein RL199_1607 [Pseudomonadota bacterium]|jgi:hypothetical protein
MPSNQMRALINRIDVAYVERCLDAATQTAHQLSREARP